MSTAPNIAAYDKLSDAQERHRAAKATHRAALNALKNFDYSPHPEMSADEILAEREHLFYWQEQTFKEMVECEQVISWMTFELKNQRNHVPVPHYLVRE